MYAKIAQRLSYRERIPSQSQGENREDCGNLVIRSLDIINTLAVWQVSIDLSGVSAGVIATARSEGFVMVRFGNHARSGRSY